jgi:hypothetical protein
MMKITGGEHWFASFYFSAAGFKLIDLFRPPKKY